MRSTNLLIKFLFLSVTISAIQPANASDSKQDLSHTARNTEFVLKNGYDEDGNAVQIWKNAIQHLRGSDSNSVVLFENRKPNDEEALWYDLIASRFKTWPDMIDSLGIPFQELKHPDVVTVIVGNQGGEDAFVYLDSVICFDAGRLYRAYGSADKIQNTGRIDRFFTHEYTHVLHNAWLRYNPFEIDSALDRAL